MTAFSDAFLMLKNEHRFDLLMDSMLQKGKAEEMIQLQQMRQFVLENENSPDPAKRQAAEEMYTHLTKIMSAQSRTPPMEQPQGPVGEGAASADMSQPPQPPEHPMMKAWMSLKKNVIGMQDGQQYSMPPAVASMAQRPQVPETAPTGFLGRQQPTGDMTTGGPQTMNVQENQANLGTAFEQQGHIPGMAEVTRAPHPSPFAGQAGNIYAENYEKDTTAPVDPQNADDMYRFNKLRPSFSGAGFGDGTQSEIGDTRQDTLQGIPRSLGGDEWTQGYSPTSAIPQGTYGDQFNPNRQF